ncbi:MAG: hypothetical protein QOF24_2315 [Verrucomicrobiota bacterium]
MRPSRHAVPLDDRLGHTLEQERQRALRTLIQNPVLTAAGSMAVEFGLVRRHAESLRSWLAHNTGWSLQVSSELARLRKTPADTFDATRPARDARSQLPFSRRRYVVLCLALAALERDERQTTLGRLAETIVGSVAAEPAFSDAGIYFDLKQHDQRRDIVQVIRFLIERHVLKRIHGDEELYLKDESSDVLYTINRPVLGAMLCVTRGPSTVSASRLNDRVHAIIEEPTADTDEARNRRTRLNLIRRMIDDPVLYYNELDERERTYLSSQRGLILKQLRQATGLEAEVRAEGIAMVDEIGDMTDLELPEEGTDGHLTLLLAEHLADRLRRDPQAVVAMTVLYAHTSALIAEHSHHWRKDVNEVGMNRTLAEATIERLAALRLVKRLPDGVLPLPAIARYALAEEPQNGVGEFGLFYRD